MKKVSVKIWSVSADCPHCGENLCIDASEFDEDHFKAFVEYETYCDQCDKSFEFQIDVH